MHPKLLVCFKSNSALFSLGVCYYAKNDFDKELSDLVSVKEGELALLTVFGF